MSYEKLDRSKANQQRENDPELASKLLSEKSGWTQPGTSEEAAPGSGAELRAENRAVSREEIAWEAFG